MDAGFGSSGILVLDKPPGMSSARVVAKVKRLTGARKVGHTGTLDPFATGVLICCLNEGTKLARFFLTGNKTYQAVLRLGMETDTQDATGNVTAEAEVPAIERHRLDEVFGSFQGAIEQLPPSYSALKHKGVPLYKWARSGKQIRKPARRVHIFSIQILDVSPLEIRFEVSCSSGTYLRTLCADIGRMLGCGGHLKDLRRIESSGYTVADAISLEELAEVVRSGKLEARMVSPAEALPDIPAHRADNTLTAKIKYGKIVEYADLQSGKHGLDSEYVKILGKNRHLLAILTADPQKREFRYCCVFPTAVSAETDC
jgi:tRNA pseudouridine55 synthase